MRGADERSGELFSCADLETEVRQDHPSRSIRKIANAALAAQSGDFAAFDAGAERPSIAPETLSRAALLQAFHAIRSAGQLMDPLELDLPFL